MQFKLKVVEFVQDEGKKKCFFPFNLTEMVVALENASVSLPPSNYVSD